MHKLGQLRYCATSLLTSRIEQLIQICTSNPMFVVAIYPQNHLNQTGSYSLITRNQQTPLCNETSIF